MSYENFMSTPQNLKDYYNIPDRKYKNVPIKIGLYQGLKQYFTKNDIYLFYKIFIRNNGLSYDASFNIWLNNSESIIFKGNDSYNAEEVYNGNNKIINELISNVSSLSNFSEASLDVQIVVGICNIGMNTNDKIYIYQAIDEPIFLGDFFDYLIENKDNDEVPRIWSISYVGFDIDDYRDKLKELIKTGYQIFNGSGDTGASTLDIGIPIVPGEPSSSPFITSVGGTKI